MVNDHQGDAQCLLKAAETPTRQDFFTPFLVALEERAWDLNAQELKMGLGRGVLGMAANYGR